MLQIWILSLLLHLRDDTTYNVATHSVPAPVKSDTWNHLKPSYSFLEIPCSPMLHLQDTELRQDRGAALAGKRPEQVSSSAQQGHIYRPCRFPKYASRTYI